MPQRSRIPVVPVLLAIFVQAAVAVAYDGPLQVRNQFPLFFPLDQPYLESADIRDLATVSLSHSSVYVIESSADWTVNMDMELTEFAIRLKKTVGARTELGLIVPVLRPTQGFMDHFLADLHDTLGTGDYGRDERPENEFLYELLYRGSQVIKPKSGQAGIGDVQLTIKRVVNDAKPLVSLMANIDIPTGDAKAGFGNGSVDAAIALLVDMDMGKQYRGYGNAGMVFPGDLKGYQTLQMRPYAYAGFGIEAAWWEHFSMIVQTVVAGSPYPSTGIRKVDWPSVMLTLGGRYSFRASRLEFSLTEDPDTAGAPDFIVNVAYTMPF